MGLAVAAISLASLLVCPRLCAEPVEAVEISGVHSISEREVRDVIGIHPGDPFSIAAIEQAISNLRKWGIFDVIEVSPSMGPEGAIIHFQLEEATVVVSIDVEGNYPYIENKVRKYLTLHPGDIYTPERLAEQVERLEAFYAREGYVGTKVFVDEEMMPELGGVVLTFRIHRGDSLRISSVTVTGNRVYPTGRFITLLETWRQFSERGFARSLRRIREFYQSHGYPKARVHVLKKEIDFEAKSVDIALEVTEGPKVDIVFEGAPHTSRKLLRRTVTILSEGSYDSYEIELSAEALKELFRQRGYPDAVIETGRTDRPDGSIVIAFRITLGVEARIKRLSFRGNDEVDRHQMTPEMINREQSFRHRGTFSPEEEQADDETILKGMRRHGYLDAAVGEWEVGRTPQGYALEVTIPIEKGPQTLVGAISFSGNDAFTIPRLLKELKVRPGKPFDEPGLEEDRKRLVAFYSDNGYPYATVEQRWQRDTQPGKANIRYDIDEGKRVTIGHILIIGDVLTSQKAIKHAMELREGDVFCYRKIVQSQLNIRRLGPFSAVTIETIGVEERSSVVHLKVKVEEERPFLVDLGIAYSTREHLTGSFTFRNINAFGWAKTNKLELTAGQRLSRALISWYDPRFFSSSFEMTTSAWVQYQKQPTYAYSQVGGALGWLRRLRRFGFSFSWELDKNYFVTGDSVAADADSLRDDMISRISLSGSYDNRDSFSDPRKGFFTMGIVDIFNEIRGNKADFFRFTWQGENDVTFLDRLTLATELRFARIQTIGKNVSVPTNELLYLGGADTIRGFSEDSLGPVNVAGQAVGGRTRWIWNEELRVRLWRTLQWAFFFDMGSLTDTFSQISWDQNVRRSAGFGVRYITPVGPLRLDYGIKLDRKPGESFGHLNFTFGYVF